MPGFPSAIAGGNGNLLVPGMQSPNFSVPEGTGWQINKDGSATFYSISLPNQPGSGTTVTFAATAPSSPKAGDVWYDTAQGLLAQTWDGSAWVPYQIGPAAIGSLSASLVGQTGNVLNPNPFFLGGDGSGWSGFLGTFSVSNSPPGGAPGTYTGLYSGPAGGVAFENGGTFSVQPGTPVIVNAVVNSSVADVAIGLNADGAVMQTVTVTPGDWTAIQAVINVPAGANTAWVQIGPADATGDVYFWGITAQPQVPGTAIQAGSISANQIQAGTVVAGIIDGTTISAATFEGTNWLENSAGQFMYSGAPALGNLILSIAPSATSDPFGNSVPAGVWIYFGNDKIGLFNQGSNPALILVPDSPTATLSPTILGFTSAHATATEQQWAVWTSGKESGNNDAAIQLASASADNSLPAKVIIEFGGAVAATWELATGLIADSWHDITLDTGWTAGAQAPQYRLLPDGNVQVRGTATHAGTTAATNINNSNPIPAAYRPSQNRVYRPPISQDTAGTVQIATGGVFAMRASGFSATQAIMDGIYAV